jgi:hypothetical protein
MGNETGKRSSLGVLVVRAFDRLRWLVTNAYTDLQIALTMSNHRWQRRNTGDARRAVAVLVIHGIGQDNIGYSNDFRRLISEKIGRPKCLWLDWNEVFWADITRDNQANYLRAATIEAPMHWLKRFPIRRWIVMALGDASAYQKVTHEGQHVYALVQERVRRGIEQLYDKEDPLRPLVIVGHSLGCHIASTYIHDLQRLINRADGREQGEQLTEAEKKAYAKISQNPFLRLETLTGFVTLGSNIPLFTFAYSRSKLTPITFPEARLRQLGVGHLRSWLNFFSPWDPLGYPLRPINDDFDALVKDIPINGGPFWPSKAHLCYWKHRTVVQKVADFLARLLDAKPR